MGAEWLTLGHCLHPKALSHHAPGNLLEGRDVHDAVVQVLYDGGHVALQEHAVHVHAVAGQLRGLVVSVSLDERQHLRGFQVIGGWDCSEIEIWG